jgi:hypothetical protein
VQVLYDEDVASHIALKPCVVSLTAGSTPASSIGSTETDLALDSQHGIFRYLFR